MSINNDRGRGGLRVIATLFYFIWLNMFLISTKLQTFKFNPYKNFIYFWSLSKYFVKSFQNRNYAYELQYYGGLKLPLKFYRD